MLLTTIKKTTYKMREINDTPAPNSNEYQITFYIYGCEYISYSEYKSTCVNNFVSIISFPLHALEFIVSAPIFLFINVFQFVWVFFLLSFYNKYCINKK